MDRASLKTGDRATVLLCIASVALMAIAFLTKLWVPRNVEMFRPRGLEYAVLIALEVALAAIWLLGYLVGLVLAYRVRRHSSIRYAAVAASFGLVAMVIANSGIHLWTVSHTLWTALVWLPLVATFAVFVSSAIWLRERQSPLESAATGKG